MCFKVGDVKETVCRWGASLENMVKEELSDIMTF